MNRKIVLSAIAFFMLASVLPAGDADIPIRLKAVTVFSSQAPPLPQRLLGQEPAQGKKGLYLVQFTGPIMKEWVAEVEGRGARVLHYVPEYSFLVWMDQGTAQGVKGLVPVRWVGFYHPGYRIEPSLLQAGGRAVLTVLTLLGETLESDITTIASFGGSILDRYPFDYYEHLRVEIDAGRIEEMAGIPGVIWIEPYITPELYDEISSEINAGFSVPGLTPGAYFTWLAGKGFSGVGVTVCIVDTGIDTGNPSTMHPDLIPRVITGIDWTGSGGWHDPCGHGTHVSGIVGANAALGTTDPNGFKYGIGVAPGVSLIAGKVFSNFCGWGGPSNPTITQWCLQNGAAVSNNSWGSNCFGSYNASSSEYDSLVRDGNQGLTGDQPLILEFSAANSGPGAGSIGCPATGKNVLTTGASQNYRPSSYGNNPDAMASFSSRGPCNDGRRKPDIVAPGTQIASTRYRAGAPLVCGSGIDGNYGYCSGTSMSGPDASGSAALFASWWKVTRGVLPSPALTKAALIVGATDMPASGGTTFIPNNDEGWGRINMDRTLVPQESMFYLDQSVVLTTGQTFSQTLSAMDPAKPLKISLVYTDKNGAAFANPALVNNLDLVVSSGGTVYRGNVFSGGWSVTGGSPDNLNNIENVYIQSPGTFSWNVSVIGTNIPQNASPNVPGQDFALVAWNAIEKRDFTLKVTPPYLKTAVGLSVTAGVFVGSLGGYVTPVTLDLFNLPTATTFSFTPGTVTPPGNSVLVITTTPSTPVGTYGLLLSGTSTDNLITHTTGLTLTVSPHPQVLNVSPDSGGQGATRALIVRGRDFQPGASVSFTGTGITVNSVTFINPSQINIVIQISSAAPLGLRDIVVLHPDGGNGTGSGLFTVTPAPHVSLATPSSGGQGAQGLRILLSGSGFQGGMQISFSPAGIQIDSLSVVSQTEALAVLTIPRGSAPGPRDITAVNPDGGISTTVDVFTVNLAPALTGAAPASVGQGAVDFSITVMGNRFMPGATVIVGGGDIQVTGVQWVDDTKIYTRLTVDENASIGYRDIVLINPDYGQDSLRQALFVAPGPKPSSLTPSSLGQGAMGIVLSIQGEGFQPDSIPSFSGSDLFISSYSYASSALMNMDVSVGISAPPGLYDLTVLNSSNGGRGTLHGAFLVNPVPWIDRAEPSSVKQGFIGDVTLIGANIQEGAEVSFNGSGVSVDSLSYQNSGAITVHLVVSPEALSGGRDVTVVNPDHGRGFRAGVLTVIQVKDEGEKARGCSCTIGGKKNARGGMADFVLQVSLVFLSLVSLKALHRRRISQ